MGSIGMTFTATKPRTHSFWKINCRKNHLVTWSKWPKRTILSSTSVSAAAVMIGIAAKNSSRTATTAWSRIYCKRETKGKRCRWSTKFFHLNPKSNISDYLSWARKPFSVRSVTSFILRGRRPGVACMKLSLSHLPVLSPFFLANRTQSDCRRRFLFSYIELPDCFKILISRGKSLEKQLKFVLSS